MPVSEMIEVRVPDIGDFKEVSIIDVLVKPNDVVNVDDPLITIESDKASMDVPAPKAGIVQRVTVKVGDKVSHGSVILTIGSTVAVPSTNGSAKGMAAPAPAEPPLTTEPDAARASVELRVPDIGDFKDVPVIDVLVKVGDRIDADSPVITIESDKASMDVPASVGGVIESIVVTVGDKVSQGSLVALIASLSAQAVPASAALPQPSLSNEMKSTSSPQFARENSVPPASSTVHASPGIRRFARELGVVLQKVTGSGPHGRITKDDVQNFVKRALQGSTGAASAAAVSGGLNLAPWPKVDFASYGPVEVKALSRIKKISGSNLHRNWVLIPHVTNNEDADITDLEAFREQVNEEQGKAGVKLTILAFLIKAVVASLQKFPEFNASLEGENLILKRYYHIGFAADTPNGLMVPIVRDADKKGVLAIAQETREAAAKAREGKVTAAEMQGGTFTISSLGGIGGTTFTPIINAPEVAILGASRSAMRPIWDGKQFMPRLILPLSLSYDHRVIDGATAARFNAYLAGVLGDMRRVML